MCRALQDERVILYNKIKDVRLANSNIPSKVLGSANPSDIPDSEGADIPGLLTPVEIQEIQEEDPVLTRDMTRLREEQAKLQELAASLLATPIDNDEEKNDDLDLEEDMVASAFVQFKTKTPVKEEAAAVPEQVVDAKPEAADAALPQKENVERAVSSPEAPTPEIIPEDTKPEAIHVQTQVEEDKDVQAVKPDNQIQQEPTEVVPAPEPETVEIKPPSDLKPEGAQAEVKPVIPVETEKVQAEPTQVPKEAPTKSESAPPKTTASTNNDSSKKQTPKKKKKRNNKNAS